MEGGGAGVDGDGVAGADGSGKFLFKAADAGPGGQPARAQHGQRLVYLGLPKVGPKKWHRYLRRGAVLKMAGHAATTRFAKVPAVDLPACPFPLAACPFRRATFRAGIIWSDFFERPKDLGLIFASDQSSKFIHPPVDFGQIMVKQ